jgi:MFS family permease
VVWLSWTLVMAGTNLAAPLYAVYARLFGFSSLVITLVFATYAVVLIPSLVVFGSLSDRVGRRPVMLAGLATALAGLFVFDYAGSTGWLFAARALQGMAVGMVSGPATAALVELDPRRAQQRPALLASLAQAGGSMLGPLVAGFLAEYAAWRLHLSFLVLAGLTVLVAVAVVGVPEGRAAGRGRWRIQPPRVPEEIRAPFARVSLTAGVVWGALSLYLSIVPSYASDLLGTHDLALLGVVSAVALAFSCLTQALTWRSHPEVRRTQAVGLVVLGLGCLALVAAGPAHSLALLMVAAAATGSGHGAGVFAAQHELNSIAPPDHRGEVTAAFICCIYAGVASSVVGSGLLALGLSLPDSIGLVAVLLAVAAGVLAVWQARVRRVA